MCGIAGYLNFGRELPHCSQLRRMCDKLIHRGPDDYGFYQDQCAALGHRRLSIIDIAGGKQPLGNEDGTLQVVFNGEIYNYRELRRDLMGRGHRFSTSSDTEVLVHLYEDAGERMPSYLEGMFAFAIWDITKRTLFLARDRFGEKPLYYSSSIWGLRFAFASELKALTSLPGFALAPDPTSICDYLALGYVPDSKSIYRGVAKLPPGHSLTVTATGERLSQYWAPSFAEPKATDFRQAVERIRSLAEEAVAGQMISEVPLGAFLSGGVDSSAVVACMAERSARPVQTFSIGFSSQAFDETEFARLVAEKCSTEHREQTVTPRIGEILPWLLKHYDEPFADASAVPMLYLARMTREHVTVALSGDGADELFGGYRRYYYGVLEERIRARFPEWFRASAFAFAGEHYPKFDYLPQVFRAKTMLSNLARNLGDSYFTSISTFRDASLTEVLSPELRQAAQGYCARQDFRARFEAVKHLAPLEQMQAVDYQTYLPGDILVKTDRATMAFSLESRAPWLDHKLAEAAFALPADFKLHAKKGKFIFKEAMRSHVPDQILGRRKMGFSVPLAEWFRTSLRPLFEASVMQPAMETHLDPAVVGRIWREHQSGLHDHGQKLWHLFMLSGWNAKHGSGGMGENTEAMAALDDARSVGT